MLTVAALVVASSMVVGQTEPREELKAFQPFIGKWQTGVEALDAPLEGVGKAGDKVSWLLEYAWTKNRNGVTIHASATVDGKTKPVIDGMIAWDPHKKEIVGLDCGAGGAISRYTIRTKEGKLTYTVQGVEKDGTLGTSTISIVSKDKDTLHWQMTNQRLGEKELPDGEVAVLKRVSP